MGYWRKLTKCIMLEVGGNGQLPLADVVIEHRTDGQTIITGKFERIVKTTDFITYMTEENIN